MHSAAAYGIAIRRGRFLNGIRPGQAIGGILIQIGNFEAPAVFLNRGCEAYLVACQGAGHVDDSLFQRNCGSSTPRVQCDLRDLFPAGHSRYMAVKTQRQRIWPGAEGIAEIVPGLAACHAGLLQTGIVIAIGHRGRSILLGLGIQAEAVGIPVSVGNHPHTIQGRPFFRPFADLNGGRCRIGRIVIVAVDLLLRNVVDVGLAVGGIDLQLRIRIRCAHTAFHAKGRIDSVCRRVLRDGFHFAAGQRDRIHGHRFRVDSRCVGAFRQLAEPVQSKFHGRVQEAVIRRHCLGTHLPRPRLLHIDPTGLTLEGVYYRVFVDGVGQYDPAVGIALRVRRDGAFDHFVAVHHTLAVVLR